MRAGILKKRVTIKSITITQSASGMPIETPTTFISGWASIEPLRGREYIEARQAQAEVDTRIRMRKQSGKTILPAMLVYFGTRVFEIVSVIEPFEAGREVQLMCRELIDG